jgi:hypothetical protein
MVRCWVEESLPALGSIWVFVLTAVVMAMNFVWVYRRVPEYGGPRNAEA